MEPVSKFIIRQLTGVAVKKKELMTEFESKFTTHHITHTTAPTVGQNLFRILILVEPIIVFLRNSVSQVQRADADAEFDRNRKVIGDRLTDRHHDDKRKKEFYKFITRRRRGTDDDTTT